MRETHAEFALNPRQQRAHAAHLLAATRGRADLEWADLLELPAWADAAEADIDRLAWATSAWLYADELRCCIDGRVLNLMRARLGDAAFAALMGAAPSTLERTSDIAALSLSGMPPHQLDEELLTTGRSWLLASIECTRIGLRLRELWWPDLHTRPASARIRSVARAAVAAALVHHAAHPGAST